jgi:Arc/MetJ family transcription regulator
MKRNKRLDSKEFSAAVGRALRRAQKWPANRRHARNADLYLEGWQGGGGEAVRLDKGTWVKNLPNRNFDSRPSGR